MNECIRRAFIHSFSWLTMGKRDSKVIVNFRMAFIKILSRTTWWKALRSPQYFNRLRLNCFQLKESNERFKGFARFSSLTQSYHVCFLFFVNLSVDCTKIILYLVASLPLVGNYSKWGMAYKSMNFNCHFIRSMTIVVHIEIYQSRL